MKEILLNQEITYAKISLFKNYSLIENKSDYDITPRPIIQSNIDVTTEPLSSHLLEYRGIDDFNNNLNLDVRYAWLDGALKDNTKYFKDLGDKKIILKKAGNVDFFTTNENAIKRNFNNPFADIIIYKEQRKIEKKDDKIIITIYKNTRNRHALLKFFKKETISRKISINTRTGNFTSVVYEKSKARKPGKIFRVNSFRHLKDILHFLLAPYEPNLKKISDISITTFNNEIFYKKICEVLEIEFRPVFLKDQKKLKENNEGIFESSLTYWICKRFLEKKKIKVPDTYINILFNFYPTEKYLKKNERKLFQSVLDMFGINSKVTNKILHGNPNIDLNFLCGICYIFGENYTKYVGMINPKWFTVQLFSLNNHTQKTLILEKKAIADNWQITDIDREDILKLLNSIAKTSTIQNLFDRHFLNLLYDHVSMIVKIRIYNQDIRIKSRTLEEFDEEHKELSFIVSKIRKGWTIEYEFNKEMLKDIETPIEVSIDLGEEHNNEIVKEVFYPVILKREEEYQEEGDFMHHCVATYADKETSIIISIRTHDGQDRITCEFNNSNGRCLQARHFCNKEAPGDFLLALSTLNKKTVNYSRLGMLHPLKKTRVPIKINGVEIEPAKVTPMLNENLFLF